MEQQLIGRRAEKRASWHSAAPPCSLHSLSPWYGFSEVSLGNPHRRTWTRAASAFCTVKYRRTITVASALSFSSGLFYQVTVISSSAMCSRDLCSNLLGGFTCFEDKGKTITTGSESPHHFAFFLLLNTFSTLSGLPKLTPLVLHHGACAYLFLLSR